jgi:hypothetical protein
VCPFTDCPDGAGYVQILRRRCAMRSQAARSSTRIAAIPGADLSKAIEDLGARHRPADQRARKRNFIERQAPFVPTNTTHVTIFAGGNDANVIGRAALAGRGGQRSERLYRCAGPAMGRRP